MFPTSNQSYGSFFDEIGSIPCPPNTALENQFTDASGERSGSIINPIGKGEQILKAISEDNDENSNKKKLKKVHKEIERKRRQEMASLHSSLRSLLPLEYIKGKRSITDHIHESVNYIKDLEKNIKELSIKRDKIQTLSNSNIVSTSRANLMNNMPDSVTITTCYGGFEIIITSFLVEEVIPLSRVLQVLLEEGLDVASYVSTQVNGRQFITIKSEVDILTRVDLSLLRQRLDETINYTMVKS